MDEFVVEEEWVFIRKMGRKVGNGLDCVNNRVVLK